MLQKLQHAILMEDVPAAKLDARLFAQLAGVADCAQLIHTVVMRVLRLFDLAFTCSFGTINFDLLIFFFFFDFDHFLDFIS